MRLTPWIAAVSAVIALSACGTNQIYFYETEKASLLAVEGRPDPSLPLQGNLGLKQRMAVIVPPDKIGGDALSFISSFRFSIDPADDALKSGAVTVRSGVLSGKAARSLTKDEAQKAAGALAGRDIPTYESLTKEIIDTATRKNQLTDLANLAGMTYASLKADPAALKTVQRVTDLAPANYTEKLHDAIAKKLGVRQ